MLMLVFLNSFLKQNPFSKVVFQNPHRQSPAIEHDFSRSKKTKIVFQTISKQPRATKMKKEKKRKKEKLPVTNQRCSAMSLISSRWSSFRVALTAINWPCAVRLERNFTFLTAISASCLVHFSVSI
jgi:hypothetical protein